MKDKNIIKIKMKDLAAVVTGGSADFPRYTTQIMNLANQNSGGTRPAVVGQLSEMIKECPHKEYRGWGEWYIRKNPNAIEKAVRKIMPMIDNLKEAISLIDEEMVRRWVEDLVITKTFIGLNVQEGILRTLSEMMNVSYRSADPSEESKGIDGYIGKMPVSIKPLTYKTKNMLNEKIEARIIYYEKGTDHIDIHIHDLPPTE